MIFAFSIFSAVIGLIIGSFLNCLIWRMYKGETLGGRSYCPECRNPIAWYDNVPVLSFIFLGRRCRHCHKKISWQYPLVEIVTAIFFFVIFTKDASNPEFRLLLARDWLLAITLIVVFVYDFRWQLVPMIFVWPMTALFFFFNLLLGYQPLSLIYFAAVGAAFFLIQYLVTDKRGVGEGDIWLGALLGLFFPAAGDLLLIMLLSYGLGAIVGLFLIYRHKKTMGSRLALGPFLALGAIITLIWGPEIIGWYLRLFS